MSSRLWARDFRAVEYRRQSLWLAPLAGAVIGVLLGTLDALVDKHVPLPAYWKYSPSTASTVLSAIVGASAALTGFVVTVTVLVVQLATGTFGARYMRIFYRDRVLKLVLAVLVGTLCYSFSLLQHVEPGSVPNLGVALSGLFIAVGLVLFLFFFDRCVHRLRPVAVAALVTRAGRDAFRATLQDAAGPRESPAPVGEPAVVVRAPRGGALQALEQERLVRWAAANDCVLVVPRAVGDFVSEGAALVRVHGAVADASAARRELAGMVALGTERTIEQDPAFALRIMVDLAARALSPAVNDPTTAVQVLNYVSQLLTVIGTHDLSLQWRRCDDEGAVRIVVAAHGWADYLSLAVTEIRQFGAESIQVMRRLSALLDELLEEVRPEHRAAVEDERRRLDATIAATWGTSIDDDRARTPDVQGIGGPAPVA